uniref:Uncharacterized protein n=1 Tax=Gopherus agassizii TaxID=38772 RepID=A0A452HJX4_9SAUR
LSDPLLVPKQEGLDNIVGRDSIREFKSSEIHDFMQRFKQRPKESLLAWLLRLWDEGADAITFTPAELGRMASLTTDSLFRRTLKAEAAVETNFPFPSLMSWLTMAIKMIWSSPTNTDDELEQWTSIPEGVSQLRQLGMLTGIFAEDFEGPDAVELTRTIYTRLLQNTPHHLKAMILLMVGGAIGTVGDAPQLMMQLTEIDGMMKTTKPWQVNVKQKERVSCTTMFKDLLKAGVPLEEIDGKISTELLKRWLQLKSEQRGHHSPRHERVQQPHLASPQKGRNLVHDS